MTANTKIEHEGIVAGISGNIATIHFTAREACSACHANTLCNMGKGDDRVLEVDVNEKLGLKKGDLVNISISQGMGLRAVLISYAIPVFLVITTLIISSTYYENEFKAGILSLSILIPYYLVVYSFNKKIKKGYIFTVEKIV